MEKKKSARELKKELFMYHDLIYGQNACYGTKDLIRYHNLRIELEKRGYEIEEETSLLIGKKR